MSERVRGKAPKAIRTSDVARPRTLLLSAIGAAAGVSVALVAQGSPVSLAKPIARPHAKIACATCHGESTSTPAPASACKTCHATGHASTRPAHQRLIANWEMSCPTCHHQHAGAQGITFEDGKVIRWGAGAAVSVPAKNATLARAGTKPLTVPLIASPCARRATIHRRRATRISACASPKSAVAQCFDEHARVRERDSDRFLAWDAAREIAATTPWRSRLDSRTNRRGCLPGARSPARSCSAASPPRSSGGVARRSRPRRRSRRRR